MGALPVPVDNTMITKEAQVRVLVSPVLLADFHRQEVALVVIARRTKCNLSVNNPHVCHVLREQEKTNRKQCVKYNHARADIS